MQLIATFVELYDSDELFDVYHQDQTFKAIGNVSGEERYFKMLKNSLEDFSKEESDRILLYRGLNPRVDVLEYGDVFIQAEFVRELF